MSIERSVPCYPTGRLTLLFDLLQNTDQQVMSDAQPQRKRKRAILEVVQEDGNSKFARALGSVDYQTREKGLQALTTWLSKRSDISEQELKRLWRGIFYCFWHADRAPFQVHRAHDMYAADSYAAKFREASITTIM